MKEPSILFDQARLAQGADQLPIDRARPSGFTLQKIDVPTALRVLDGFLEEDEAEQKETFDYLKKALDETRAAQGESLLFSNE